MIPASSEQAAKLVIFLMMIGGNLGFYAMGCVLWCSGGIGERVASLWVFLTGLAITYFLWTLI